MVDLGTLGGGNSVEVAVNTSGMVVGSSERQSGGSHAFAWTLAGGMVDLGTLPGTYSSQAVAVDDDGMVVGFVTNAANISSAFAWTAATGMVILGVPAGSSAQA